MTLERPQPLNEQPERALLGGLLCEPGHLLGFRGELDASDFHLPHHGRLFGLLCEMLDGPVAVDLVTVMERVTRIGADSFGGAGYVAELPEHCPSTVNLRSYARLVKEHARTRRLRQVATTLGNAASGSGPFADMPPAELASMYSLQLAELATDTGEKVYQSSLADAFDMAETERMERETGARPPGVVVGFPDLEQLVTFQPGDLVIIGGETSMGKSALAQAFACGIARDPTAAVLYHTLEMPRPRLAIRLAACLLRIPARAIREGRLLPKQEEALDRFKRAIASGDRFRIEINDRPGVTFEQIRTSARAQRARGGLRALFVDHLHIMRLHRAESRNVAVAETTAQFKELALELEVPVFLLAQFNRGGGERDQSPVGTGSGSPAWWEDVRLPVLENLRDSGAIAQDADTVLFPIHAGKCGVPDLASAGAIVVAKQREGELGVIGCEWDGPCAAYRPYRENR